MDEDFDQPHLDPEEIGVVEDTLMDKQNRLVALDKWDKEFRQRQIEESRKPLPYQMAEYGDYMADGSDDQGWDMEEQDAS